MSQAIFSDINPEVTTGLMLSGLLTAFKNAVVSNMTGTSRPPALAAGGFWIDTSRQNDKSEWDLRVFNGTQDLLVLRVNLQTGVSGFNLAFSEFTVRRPGDNASPAEYILAKARTGTGQVRLGDSLGDMRFLARNDIGTSSLAANISSLAEEDFTSGGNKGVVVNFSSAPKGDVSQNHMRLKDGFVEVILPLKVNGLIHSVDTKSAGEDLTLTDSAIVTEVTGTTASSIAGITPTANSHIKTILNLSAEDVTLLAQSESAAQPKDRLALEGNISLKTGEAATLIYDHVGERWRVYQFSLGGSSSSDDIDEIESPTDSWTAPKSGVVSVTSIPKDWEDNGRLRPIRYVMEVAASVSYSLNVGDYCYFDDLYLGDRRDKIIIKYLS